MSIWDDILGIATRTGARNASQTSQRRNQGALKASPAMLRKAAKKPGLWDNIASEASSFFKPAGVLYKNVQDLAHGGDTDAYQKSLEKSRAKPAWQKLAGAVVGPLMPGLGAALGYDPLDNPISNTIRALPEKTIPTAVNAYSKVHVPNAWANPLLAMTEATMHPIDSYNRLSSAVRGVNLEDGDFQSNLGSRGQEIWQGLQEDVARVEALDKRKPYTQQAAEAFLPDSAAQYFDPNSEDVSSAYEKAGYDPMTSLAGALSNPLEWLGAESAGELGARLANASTARKAINAAGKLMDPTQMALDAVAKAPAKLASIDWKLPGRAKNAPLPTEEIARRAGVDPEAMRAYSQAQEAPAASNAENLWDEVMRDPEVGSATKARIGSLVDETIQPADQGERLWDDLMSDGSIGDATRGRIEGLLDEAQSRPPEAPVAPQEDDLFKALADEPVAALHPLESPAGPADDAMAWLDNGGGALVKEAPQSVPGAGGAVSEQAGPGLVEPVPAAMPEAGSPALGMVDEIPAPVLATPKSGVDTQSARPETYNRFDRYAPRTDKDGRHIEPASVVPSDSHLSVSPREVEDRMAATGSTDRFATEREVFLGKLASENPEYLAYRQAEQESMDALFSGAPSRVRKALDSRASALRALVPQDVLDQEIASSILLHQTGIAENVAAWEALKKSQANPANRGLKLYSNPFDPTIAWDAAKVLNKGIGNFFTGIEGFIGGKVDNFVSSKPLLNDFRTSLKRLFSENYGVASKELGDRITEHQMQGNAIRRMANETIYHQLNVGDETQRKAMMGYMNGSLSKADAGKVLPPEYLQSADSVRYLMDDAGAKYIATSLDIDADFLRQASTEEKQLVRQLYETFDNKQTNVGPQFNLTRKQVLANAAPTHSPQFIQKAQNLIDGAMQRMQKQGFVQDGRIVDMGLDFGTWIANLGKYEPRLYKAIEYGVDLSSPTAAMDFVGAIEHRHQVAADALNELNKAQGLPPVAVKPMSDDIKNFLLANYTGDGAWNGAVAQEAGRFMKRKELSQELRDILGPMVNPAYTYTKGVQHVHLMENLLKVRRWVANNDSMVSRAGETVEEFMKRTGVDRTDIAFDMATNPAYASQVGALQGRFMHRDVADMMSATGVIPHLTGPDALDNLKSLSRTWLAMSKVILNPTSHVRQFLQNGLSIWQSIGARGVVDMFGGVRDLKSKSQAYLEARNAGLFSAGHDENFWAKVDLDSMPEFTWDGNEHFLAKIARSTEWLGSMATVAQKGYAGLKRGAAGVNSLAAKSFAAGDDLAKLAAFKHFRRQGYQPIEAAKKAADEVFTGTGRDVYSRLQSGLGVRGTRYDRGARSGGKYLVAEALGGLVQQPFFGATKFVWDQAARGLMGIRGNHWMPMTDPARAMRTWSLMAAGYGLGQLGRNASGLTAEEESNRKPDYMRSLLPTHAMLPPQLSQLISSDGSTDWWDYSALVPFGVPAQGKFDAKKGRMTNLLDNAAATFIPGVGATSKLTGMGDGSPINPMLKPWMELWQNQDSFSGRQIYPEHRGSAAQARPVMAHLWRSYLPPWAPNPAGLLEAWNARPTRLDDPQQMQEFVRAGLQGVATDSGHLASKFISGAVNSLDYATLGKQVSDARRILDYRGRDQYMGKVFADLLGIRIESRMAGEIARQRNNTKKVLMAQKTQEYKQAIRNARGEQRTQLTREYQREKQALLSSKPSLRWYESAGDSFLNALNALGSLKFSDAERRMLGASEDVT